MNRPLIDPELRALLREIATDPRARLFRSEIPRPTRLALRDGPTVGLHAAGLTAAERELLRAHREELAKLLRDSAEWKIQQHPHARVRVTRYANATERIPKLEHADLIANARRQHRALSRFEHLARHGWASARAHSLLSSPATSAYEYASFSLRFVPHDAAWIHVARDLREEEDAAAASRILTDVVRRGHSANLQMSALSFLGVRYEQAGAQASAAACFARSSALGVGSPNIDLSWLAESLSAGDITQTLEAAARIDDRLTPGCPALDDWLAQLDRRMQLLPLFVPLTESVRRTAQELLGRVGPTSTRVITAIDHYARTNSSGDPTWTSVFMPLNSWTPRGPSAGEDPPPATHLAPRRARHVS